MALSYLTVQDILWINLQITKKVQHFNYARLEEATFYQYAYGDSKTLLPQAARFVTGFLRLNPLDAGNEPTALIACLTFLQINGCAVSVSDADLAAWFEKVSRSEIEGDTAISQIASAAQEGHHHPLVPDIRSAIRGILARYAPLIAGLYDGVERQSA